LLKVKDCRALGADDTVVEPAHELFLKYAHHVGEQRACHEPAAPAGRVAHSFGLADVRADDSCAQHRRLLASQDAWGMTKLAYLRETVMAFDLLKMLREFINRDIRLHRGGCRLGRMRGCAPVVR
jgi:hypothetical protein